MLRGLYTAHTGLRNEQNRMDILTNNLANASTVGFKKEGSTSQPFREVLAVKIKDSSVGLGTVQPIGHSRLGVKIGENYTDYTQGSFRITDNTYDLALAGSGFFALEYTDSQGETSTKYTRAGNFTLTQEGYLVNNDGMYVLDTQNRRIQLDTLKDAAIDSTGSIIQDGRQVARIQVTDFEDYDYLEKFGDTFFQPVEGATPMEGSAEVKSGVLEMSNVDLSTEFTEMITTQRGFQANSRIITTSDTLLEELINLKR